MGSGRNSSLAVPTLFHPIHRCEGADHVIRHRFKFAAAGAVLILAAATAFAAEPVASSPAKPQTTENSADTKLAASGRTAATSRAVQVQDKSSKVRPAYCREPQQWYYYDQTPGELSDCQK
jgi:hypothetical protein